MGMTPVKLYTRDTFSSSTPDTTTPSKNALLVRRRSCKDNIIMKFDNSPRDHSDLDKFEQ